MKRLEIEDIEVLHEVGHWKVITSQNLFQRLGSKTTYSVFCRRVKKLEEMGFLKGFYERRKRKYLTLTEQGSALSIFETSGNFSENINHDLLCTAVIQSLLKFKLFDSGNTTKTFTSKTQPDGVIHARRYGVEYTLAIEVELHQKTEERVRKKFVQYSEEEVFNHVLYITNKRSVFDSYRKIIMEMRKEIREKIIFGLDTGLFLSEHDYQDSIYWMDGEFLSFQKLFGEEVK